MDDILARLHTSQELVSGHNYTCVTRSVYFLRFKGLSHSQTFMRNKESVSSVNASVRLMAGKVWGQEDCVSVIFVLATSS